MISKVQLRSSNFLFWKAVYFSNGLHADYDVYMKYKLVLTL